ncbi:MAG: hypothetical protein JRE23_17460 [Deltaproteobacteria bacterium]|nr:hypothetical protein [Deltaproteobacteria bacterium]
MKHCLVTPWNIDNVDPEWLTERQVLFEKFCLPSVQSQTDKNFEWILVADARTPDTFKEVIEAYPATVLYGDFENLPVPKKGVERPKNRFHRALQLEVATAAPLKKYLEAKDVDYIITTRLDSDDAISTNHIDKIWNCVRQHKSKHDRFWLNLVRGYKWCSGNVYPIGALQNPFISFIEPQGDLLTTYQCCHQLAPKSGYPVVGIREGHPTWMQVIHGGNLMNKLMRFRGEMPFENVSDKFKIKE